MRLSAFATAALAAAVFTTLHPSSAHAAAAIGAGDLVVVRVGDGTTVASGSGLPVILDEYKVTYSGVTPTGVSLVQSIPVPTATSGTAPTTGNRYLVQGGTAGGEGGLLLSADGKSMTLAGYNTTVGSALNSGSTTTEDRVVGILDLSTGNIDTTTAFSGFTGSGPGGTASRGAYMDSTGVYLAASTGVRFGAAFTTNTGTGTSVGSATANNARRDIVYKGQLYQSEAANNRSGIETIGTGEPTTTGGSASLLPGFSTTNSTYSPYDFFFANDTTLYISDDRNSGTGGLEKWTFDGTTWSMAYNLLVNTSTTGGTTNAGIRSLTGLVDDAGDVTLFGSTTAPSGGQGNFVYGFSDTLANTNVANVTANKLVTATTDFTGGSLWSVRGVALAPAAAAIPEPATASLLVLPALALLTRRRDRNA